MVVKRPYDQAMMELALSQAELGRGRTSPNPLVGAVVVDETAAGPVVLSSGYHARVGSDHAEVAALRPLSERAPGKTLYVTLEPCNHVGRTGKCSEAILRAGIARVVIGMRDPNQHVAGGGAEVLRAAGVAVDEGVLEAACRAQNRGYLRWLSTGRPQMILKAAVSLDGRLGPRKATPATRFLLTDGPAQRRAHELRDACDAVLIGRGTLQEDDPLLTVRLEGSSHQPLRVVLSGSLDVPESARLIGPGTLILTSERAAADRPRLTQVLRDRGAQVLALPGVEGSTRLEVGAVLDALGRLNLLYVLCEGGADVHGALLRAGAYHEAAIFVAPVLLGDGGVPLSAGSHAGPDQAASALWLDDVRHEVLGRDVLVRGAVRQLQQGGGLTLDHLKEHSFAPRD